MLAIVRKTFPPWFLGIIGGAGALTAMVPAAILILTAATLFAKNVCRPILAPGMTDQQVARLAKIMVFPGMVLGLYSKRATMPGVFAGLYSRVGQSVLPAEAKASAIFRAVASA
jgi:Na+/proline symporter